jgi:AraC-like DNA-binding protein
MSKHFRVPSRISDKLQELGIRVSAVLQSGGLRPDLLDQTRVLVTTEEFFALWRGIGRNSDDPAIGLLLGTSKPEHFAPVALAALSTGSFGEAVHQIARYKQLSCPEEVVHETDDGEWSIQFRWLLATDNEPDVLTDLCFAWILSIARLELGETAYLLGYEDSNSFVRAFRTWEGVPPAHWRGAQRKQAVS